MIIYWRIETFSELQTRLGVYSNKESVFCPITETGGREKIKKGTPRPLPNKLEYTAMIWCDLVIGGRLPGKFWVDSAETINWHQTTTAPCYLECDWPLSWAGSQQQHREAGKCQPWPGLKSEVLRSANQPNFRDHYGGQIRGQNNLDIRFWGLPSPSLTRRTELAFILIPMQARTHFKSSQLTLVFMQWWIFPVYWQGRTMRHLI